MVSASKSKSGDSKEGGRRYRLRNRRRCTINSLIGKKKKDEHVGLDLAKALKEDAERIVESKENRKPKTRGRRKRVEIPTTPQEEACIDKAPKTPPLEQAGTVMDELVLTPPLPKEEETANDVFVKRRGKKNVLNKENLPGNKRKATETDVSPKETFLKKQRKLEARVHELSKERDVALKKLRKQDTLEASVQAQVAARGALETHTVWLEKKNQSLAQAQKEADHMVNLWRERCMLACGDLESLQFRQSSDRGLMQELLEKNRRLQESLERSECTRRQLHETVMTQRGNMRVYCRLRPLSGETNGSFQLLDCKKGDNCKNLRVHSAKYLSVDGRCENSKSKDFEFDRVFHPGETQEGVFKEVSELVQSALDGYHVCMFAYGQTGSGKTHTMMGSDASFKDRDGRGIIPRTIELLMSTCRQTKNEASTRYQLRLSMLEIYNDNLVDLLPVKKKAARSGKAHSLRIRHDSKDKTKTFVEGLNVVVLEDAQHASELLEKAHKARSTAKTKMNDRSSRSHCVLTLYIDHIDSAEVLARTSSIHLVDLAGSERFASAGAGSNPKQVKEQCAINTSLTSLKNSLTALATKQAHVPFRDSKLTHVLQNALQSDSSKTLMICTASQHTDHLGESLNSLRFAAQILKQE